MVTLEAAEVEIALIALFRFTEERETQTSDKSVHRVSAAAWWSTRHCRHKANELIKRLEQALQDEREGNNAET